MKMLLALQLSCIFLSLYHILGLYKEILSLKLNLNFLFIDDGSTDGTWEIIKKIKKSNKKRVFTIRRKVLDTLFDYFQKSHLIINHDIINLFEQRLENLNDYYEARINSNDNFYLDPSFLYIDKKYFKNIIKNFEITKLSPFYNEDCINTNLKKINNISSIRKEIDFNFIKKFFEINSKENKIIICCNSKGSLEKVYKLLNENIFIFPFEIKNLSNLSEKNIFITVLEIEESFHL